MITTAVLGELIQPAPTRKAGVGDFPVLSMTMRGGLVDQHTKFKKRVASADTSGYSVVARGQLVVGFPIDEAVLSFQETYQEAIVSPAYGIWDLKDRLRVHRPYLERYLRSPRAIGYYKSNLRGSTARRRSLPRPVFLKMPVPLPPIKEQRRIAAVLDAADALRAKRHQAIAKLDSLTQAIFIDMFGDPRVRPHRFDTAFVGELATNEDSRRIPVKMADRDQMEGEYPYYGASGVIDHVDGYIFEGRRLLVAEDGANLLARSSAIAFLAEGRYWVNNHAHVLADNGRANLIYLRQAIESLDLSPYVTGSAQPKLNRRNLDSLPIAAPARARQDEFAARISKARELELSVSACLNLLDVLFASLQQRAFRGEL